MTRYDFMEKIGFFFVGKTGDLWHGRLTKQAQLDAFGFYLGKGLITIDQLNMVVKHTVRIAFGQESTVNKVLTTDGYFPDNGKPIPLSAL